jgi:Pentapeptide repeats (9 copies)/Pentapeptide repeats (8 copies)
LAAFAVDHPAEWDQLVRSDALTALQILAFRKTENDIGFDLRTGRFPGSILADDATKRYADFRHFDLYKADLSGSDLYRAQLFGANLRLANVNGSNLVGADLSNAGLSSTTFCPGLNFAVPVMVHSYPVAADMKNTTFYSATGEGTKFDWAIMHRAVFNGAKFGNPSFVHTVLREARFERSELVKPDFTGADLTNASFEGATMTQPIFVDATLNGTNLHAKGIVDEDLRAAHLCNVIGPSGKTLGGDCKGARQEPMANVNPPSEAPCKPL